MPWTTEQVLALAPDASSAKSGKDLAAARKWSTLGANRRPRHNEIDWHRTIRANLKHYQPDYKTSKA